MREERLVEMKTMLSTVVLYAQLASLSTAYSTIKAPCTFVNRPFRRQSPLQIITDDSVIQEAPTKRVVIGSAPEFAIANDSTVETPFQRLVVSAHFALLFINLYSATSHMNFVNPMDVIAVATTVMLSVVLGDLGTGVFHWSVDNYGSLQTPIVGSVCAAFQGHHETPWTITFRSFANNVYKIAYGTIPVLALVSLCPQDWSLQKVGQVEVFSL